VINSKHGEVGLYGLVNCAATGHCAIVDWLPMEEYRQSMEVGPGDGSDSDDDTGRKRARGT
jgi:hypothetical protein